MQSEAELVNHLNDVIVDKLKFQTYPELTITSKHLDLQKMIKQDQLRIDLAAINQLDSSIYFFEAETELHVKHPAMYCNFCDYCYLVCPDEAFDSLPSETKRQQVSWAEETGLGIITISKEGALRKRLSAKQQSLVPEVRKDILRMMNKRYRIRFSSVPLWKRSRKDRD
ncbi:MAG: hypothetical protein JSW11_05290 [Candidatus Heimdallarchaeota archaeon]|nr:MAG: hypothetical protein JSW11_05290 [Candidatus Heimdallarchaeota archaeon]